MKARADYIRVTNSSILTNVTLQFDRRDLQFQDKEGVQTAIVNIYGRVTSMSRRVVNVFEDVVTVEAPAALLQEAVKGASVYQKTVPLAPGLYRLNIVAKDVVGGNMNNYELALRVPHYDDDALAASSLIFADLIEKVPTRSIGTGQFVVASTKVRPRVTDTFRQSEKLGVYVQLYNFGADEKTQKPSGSIEYEVVKNGTNEKVFEFTEDLTAIDGASATQVTVEKILPLANLQPGQYTFRMKVTDKIKNQTVTPSGTFTVN